MRLDITQLRSAISSWTNPHITIWPFTICLLSNETEGKGRKRAMNWKESFRENPKPAGVFEQVFISFHPWKNSCHLCLPAWLACSDPSFGSISPEITIGAKTMNLQWQLDLGNPHFRQFNFIFLWPLTLESCKYNHTQKSHPVLLLGLQWVQLEIKQSESARQRTVSRSWESGPGV